MTKELPDYEDLPPHLKRHVEFVAVALSQEIVHRAMQLVDVAMKCGTTLSMQIDEQVGKKLREKE